MKRVGIALDGGFSHPNFAFGSKRSLTDMLGSSADADAVRHDDKRQHGVNGKLGFRAEYVVDDAHLSKGDLRFKIMKQTRSNCQQKVVDLRDKLSRQVHPSSANHRIIQSLPDPQNGRQRAPQLTPEPRVDKGQVHRSSANHRIIQSLPESQNGRQRAPQLTPEPRVDKMQMPEVRDDRLIYGERRHIPETRGGRLPMPETGGERWSMPEARDERQRMPEPRDGRRLKHELIGVPRCMPKSYDNRQWIPDPLSGGMPSRVTSTRTSEAMSQMNLLRNSYSMWTSDHIKCQSPHRNLGNYRGLSPPPPPPPPRMEESQKKTIMGAYNDPRMVTYVRQDVDEIVRTMTSGSFPPKPSLLDEPTKPGGALVSPQLPLGGIVQQSQYPVEHLTVEGFLRSLGLDKYVILFKVEEVDMAVLRQMGNQDLKELGVPMGPRKKILLALFALARRQAR